MSTPSTESRETPMAFLKSGAVCPGATYTPVVPSACVMWADRPQPGSSRQACTARHYQNGGHRPIAVSILGLVPALLAVVRDDSRQPQR